MSEINKEKLILFIESEKEKSLSNVILFRKRKDNDANLIANGEFVALELVLNYILEQ